MTTPTENTAPKASQEEAAEKISAFDELPDHIQDDLRAAAKRQGYASVEDFFNQKNINP